MTDTEQILKHELVAEVVTSVDSVIKTLEDFKANGVPGLARVSLGRGFKAELRVTWLGVGTGVGEADDPAKTEATFGVTRSVDCPEAPTQAHPHNPCMGAASCTASPHWHVCDCDDPTDHESDDRVVRLAAVLGDFAVADEHTQERDDLQLARLLVARGVAVTDKESGDHE